MNFLFLVFFLANLFVIVLRLTKIFLKSLTERPSAKEEAETQIDPYIAQIIELMNILILHQPSFTLVM